VYALVFPYLLRATTDNYIVYLVTGIIPWTYFQTVLMSCVGCIKGNAGIIKKVYFPKVILPVSAMISGFINFMISCIIILIFSVIWQTGISWHIIIVPLVAVIEGLFALGLGLIGAACNAYLQDLEYIINFLVQLLFYGTPIVYDLNTFSPGSFLYRCIQMNPMTKIMNAYRDCFLYHRVPSMHALLIVALISIALVWVGYMIFKKLEKGFAEQF
jgi:ABC-type polysaccharide/polyol phosphate export permease